MPEITCVIRSPIDLEDRVVPVGGQGWRKPVNDVIREIDDGSPYLVQVNGSRVRVEARFDRAHPYLRTDSGKTAENRLLYLPECREGY